LCNSIFNPGNLSSTPQSSFCCHAAIGVGFIGYQGVDQQPDPGCLAISFGVRLDAGFIADDRV